MKMSDKYEVKKCGVKFDPAAIVISYMEKGSTKLRRRTMPLRDFTRTSRVEKAADELRSNPRHKNYVACIPKAQLERLITIVRDKMNGMSLEASLARNDEMDKIDPEEDLNRVDEETLVRKKAVMDNLFEKNRKKPGDEDFKYDIEVDFDQNDCIESGWDSGDNESDQEF